MIGRGYPPSILEIGARARSGQVYRDFIPENARYVGFDIKGGENVDVVGDAHELSKYFDPASFDAVYSMATFEHLLMPWKVGAEMNRVMKMGATAFILTHQTYPLHEEPWDFWRFSDKAWLAIFNRFTGFEIIDTELFQRAFVTAINHDSNTYMMDRARAYLGSTVLCRKIGPCLVDWSVDASDLVETLYPA
jgi:hypothetical protein